MVTSPDLCSLPEYHTRRFSIGRIAVLNDFTLQNLVPRSINTFMISIPSVLAAHCGLVPQPAFTAQDFPHSRLGERRDDHIFLGSNGLLSRLSHGQNRDYGPQ